MTYYELGCICRFKPIVPRSGFREDWPICDGRCQYDEQAKAELEAAHQRAAERMKDKPGLTPEELAMPWQEVIRDDVAAYAAEFNIDETKVWDALSTPYSDLSDEQAALVTHELGWALRRYGLQDAVTVSVKRGDG